MTAPCPHRGAGVSARARQGEGRLPAGLPHGAWPRGECEPQPNGETFTYVLYNIQRNQHPRQHDFHSQRSPRLMGLWGKQHKEKYSADFSALKKNLPSFEQTPDLNFEKVKFCNSHTQREKTVHMVVGGEGTKKGGARG